MLKRYLIQGLPSIFGNARFEPLELPPNTEASHRDRHPTVTPGLDLRPVQFSGQNHDRHLGAIRASSWRTTVRPHSRRWCAGIFRSVMS